MSTDDKQREFLQALVVAVKSCLMRVAMAGSCAAVAEECGNCDDEFSGHECEEHCCCCLYPEENVPCDMCGGKGYFEVCLGPCDENGNHKKSLADCAPTSVKVAQETEEQ